MGVYIHIPFCRQLCSYCDFYSVMSLERKSEMLSCLLREMELRAAGENFDASIPETLYFGGGTPSVYSPAELKILADTAIRLFLPHGTREYTVEANPDDLSPDYLHQLKEIGVNRLSIGLQSFIDRDLLAMKRRHTGEGGAMAVKAAQRAGFDNISVDLIYGFPAMTSDEWRDNIKRVLDLNIQHVSAYHLTIEPNTLLGTLARRGKFTPVDEDTSAAQYEILIEMMNNAGFVQYEVSNFALHERKSQHNSAYWQRKPYIGIGPSAHGYDGKFTRRKNEANNIRYIKAINENRLPEEIEILTDTDVYNEMILTSLRTDLGFDTKEISHKYREYFVSKAEKYVKQGFLLENDGVFAVPPKYLFVSDSILVDLFMI